LEPDLIPYSASIGLSALAALVLAPHPDDEVFGCAGAIASHVRAGVPVQVVILTDGAGGGDAATREEESRAAAVLLGYGQPEFWSLPDRGLLYSEALVQRIVRRIAECGADLVYAPSPWEVHPDHRQTSQLAMEAVRRSGNSVRLAFYEVGAPLRPNLLLDISAFIALKEEAMACFASQRKQQDYARHIRALNQFRTYTLGPDILAAEAYWVLAPFELDLLAKSGAGLPISPGISAGPEAAAHSLPLVSILIRSMDQECLAQALDSVSLQTYPHIEVVVVAARPEHRPLPGHCGPFTLRLVQTDAPLPRGHAANRALAQARGEWLLFLDDDDWLMPGHIARLAQVATRQPEALAVYTGISLVDAQGRPMGQTFDLPFDAIRQLAGNLAPIHAVLFSAKVLALGCRFDESLALYEDWDFWLQLAKLAPMVHLPGVSAVYRIHDSSGVHAEPGPTGAAAALVYEKWAPDWTPQLRGQMMQRVWTHPELEARLDEVRHHLAQTLARLSDLNQSLADTERRLAQSIQQLNDAGHQLDSTREQLAVATQQWEHTRQQLSNTAQQLAEKERQLDLANQQLVDTQIRLENSRQQLTEQAQVLEDTELLLESSQLQLSDTQLLLAAAQQELAHAHRVITEHQLQAAQEAQQIESLHHGIHGLAAQLTKEQHDRAAMLSSRSWRVTRPLRWLTDVLRPSLLGKAVRQLRATSREVKSTGKVRAPLIAMYRKAYAFWRKYGTRVLAQRIRAEVAHKVEQTAVLAQTAMPFIHAAPASKGVNEMISTRFESLRPLSMYLVPPSPHPRVNIVTDSIARGSLFGGVGTALIFGTLLANRMGADLRIITRTEKAQAENVDHILSVYGLALEGEIDFKFLPSYEQKQNLDFSTSDLFITTSWWTTAATLGSVPSASIIYLLQEDERMFYPFGDDRLRCEAILRNREIRFVLNTRLLFDHLVADGLSNLVQQGSWFEPAFPTTVFRPRPHKAEGKRKFIFYARPNNLRNLFYLGIEVINAAIAQQVLNPQEWEIIFVGKDIPDMSFEGGVVPTKLENLSWSDYAELAGTIDLGLSLMYTPHPSYPPLDLAASGAVVVTNRFGGKQDLDRYSANLICADAERDALVEALRQGVALARNSGQREKNFQANGLCLDWNIAFSETLERIAGKS
jgi:LmbE family N-acetylglucosaminyl deacetylase